MRLAFVISTRRWGGTKTWSLDMARAALADGHDVGIYGRDPRFIESARAHGMYAGLVDFGMDFSPRAIAFFSREFRARGITHLIVNVGKDLRTAGIAARLAGIPVTVHVGAPHDFSDSFLRRRVHAFVRPSYICCSEYTARHIVRHVPYLRRARVAALHPGTFMPKETPAPSRPPYTLITTSQLTLPKRHEDLVRACALLRREGTPFALRIVGTGDQEGPLRALVREYDLGDAVSFAGFASDVAAELRRADIFVLPTDAEPLGIALEEAMAHGLFPLARNAGGVPEIWPPEFARWLLPPLAGPEEFAAALRELLRVPPAELDAWRLAVQTHARGAFSLQTQWRRFADFLAPAD